MRWRTPATVWRAALLFYRYRCAAVVSVMRRHACCKHFTAACLCLYHLSVHSLRRGTSTDATWRGFLLAGCRAVLLCLLRYRAKEGWCYFFTIMSGGLRRLRGNSYHSGAAALAALLPPALHYLYLARQRLTVATWRGWTWRYFYTRLTFRKSPAGAPFAYLALLPTVYCAYISGMLFWRCNLRRRVAHLRSSG